MTDKQLQKLIESDEFGFLAVKPPSASKTPDEERVLEIYNPIADFIRANEFPPEQFSGDQTERRLAHQLAGLQNDETCRKLLRSVDEFGLFGDKSIPLSKVAEDPAPYGQVKEAETIDDVLSDPALASLLGGDDEGSGIFDLKHVPAPSDVESPDYVAQRAPCDDFDEFEPLLRGCQEDLKERRRRLLPFANEQNIEVGHFYVLRGVLLYVAGIGERIVKNGKWNARLRCIFESGTESDMLLRSLSTELYKDGRRVTMTNEELLDDFIVSDDDNSAGFIYVLRSLSEDPQITSIPDLFKIGLASKSVESRIKNARNEPTYLMSDVEIVASFEVYNVNLNKLEQLLHRFFAEVAVQIQVTDNEGNYHTPKEWFSVPIDHVRRAVELLISGEIVSCKYLPGIGIEQKT